MVMIMISYDNGFMIIIWFMISVLWWFNGSLMIYDLFPWYPSWSKTYATLLPKWFALIPCDPVTPVTPASTLAPWGTTCSAHQSLGDLFQRKASVCKILRVRCPRHLMFSLSGRDQPTVTQGFMKKQGYPPSWVFLAPWDKKIYLPDWSQFTKSRPT